jgi:hypothetical protein
MNLNQIKTAVRSGKTVHVGNAAYSVNLHVFPDGSEQWNILHSGGSCIGLTHQDGVTLNAPAGDFRVAAPVRPSYAGFPPLAIENGYTGGRLCIMADSVNPGSDAIHVATCNDSRYARLFASAPRLLSALDYLQSAPNDARNHRRALDAMAEARGEVVKDSGLDGFGSVPASVPKDCGGMVLSQAVLVAVVNASGGLVSCDVEWSAHPGSREVPAGWAVHVVPLSLALQAGSLRQVLSDLVGRIMVAKDHTESVKDLQGSHFLLEARSAVAGPVPSGWASVDV